MGFAVGGGNGNSCINCGIMGYIRSMKVDYLLLIINLNMNLQYYIYFSGIYLAI